MQQIERDETVTAGKQARRAARHPHWREGYRRLSAQRGLPVARGRGREPSLRLKAERHFAPIVHRSQRRYSGRAFRFSPTPGGSIAPNL